MDSLILQTAIGLVFVFATAAGLVSVITESISRYVGLRAEFLLRGVRTLIDGGGTFKLPFWEAVTGRVLGQERKAAPTTPPISAATAAVTAAASAKAVADARSQKARKEAEAAHGTPAVTTTAEAATTADQAAQAAAAALGSVTSAAQLLHTPGQDKRALVAQVMSHPLIGVTAKAGQMLDNAGDAPLRNRQRRKLPSYVSGRSFARALIDLILPNANGQTTMTAVRDAIATTDLPVHLRSALLSMADETTVDIATFRTNLEHWYDDQMARVSGWYKRRVRWVSLGIGVIIILAFNLNALTIARSIYADEAVRGSVVTQATQASKCDKGPAECLQELRSNIASLRGAGLPIGWTKVPQCAVPESGCNWFEDGGLWVHNGPAWLSQLSELGLILLGWAIMVIALLPGSNFWFDMLGRLGTLRASGPKPKTT